MNFLSKGLEEGTFAFAGGIGPLVAVARDDGSAPLDTARENGEPGVETVLGKLSH